MKKSLSLLLALAFGATLTAQAVTKASPDSEPGPARNTPGVELAQTLSTVTGVAISPLFGVGAVGAWKYYHTLPEKRANLPWFAQPAFWMPALLLVALVGIKDVLGTTAPVALKKPFDIAEAIENKISGLVAAGAFVPLLVTTFHDTGTETVMLSSMGFATMDLSWLYNVILVPVAVAAFIVVWLVGNAIHVLIVLSPFTTVDTVLKGSRLALLATVPATSYINPWLGALWAIIIIIVSWFIAGWSLRLTHFGIAFLWDYLTLRSKRFTPDPTANKMFLGRKLNKVPVRTYGRLTRNDAGKLVLNYRPWFVLPARTVELPEGNYAIGCGLLYCEIMRAEGADTKTMLLLPPRYRGHETELVRIYGLAGTREVGLRAAWKWLKELFGFKAQVKAAAA
ncbi:MAG TPA: hypothetical protein VFR76_10245 [Verrucomicrobiae bacterium]|nr:hypothetical protein [Verrucomicrobiae bacterium]